LCKKAQQEEFGRDVYTKEDDGNEEELQALFSALNNQRIGLEHITDILK
jgi:dihydroorotase